MPCARGNLRGPGIKTDAGGLAQQIRQLRPIQRAQRGRALAPEIFRQDGRGLIFQPPAQFGQRCVERLAQQQDGRMEFESWLVANLSFPDDVQDDILEIWITVVAVRAPVVAAQIHLHVAGARRFGADLNDGAAKIRPALGVRKAGMQHADRPAIQRLQLVAPQPLVHPDGLEQAFGGKTVFVAQDIRSAIPGAPIGVEIFNGRVQTKLLLPRSGGEVNLF